MWWRWDAECWEDICAITGKGCDVCAERIDQWRKAAVGEHRQRICAWAYPIVPIQSCTQSDMAHLRED
jgi:hypothetical protein